VSYTTKLTGKRSRKRISDNVSVTVRLPLALVKALREYAVSNHRDVSSTVRLFVAEGLKFDLSELMAAK
jgi:hypothetical protein